MHLHGSTVHCMCTNMHVASMCPSLYDHRMIGKKREREGERDKERKKERGKTAGKQCKQPTCASIACIWRNEDSPFSARSCPSRCCRAAFSRSSVTKRSECSTWSQNLPVLPATCRPYPVFKVQRIQRGVLCTWNACMMPCLCPIIFSCFARFHRLVGCHPQTTDSTESDRRIWMDQVH